MSFGSETKFPDKEATEEIGNMNKKYNDQDNIVSRGFIPKLNDSEPPLLKPKANKLMKKLKKLKAHQMNLAKS